MCVLTLRVLTLLCGLNFLDHEISFSGPPGAGCLFKFVSDASGVGCGVISKVLSFQKLGLAVYA
jgi:hypothetical protein